MAIGRPKLNGPFKCSICGIELIPGVNISQYLFDSRKFRCIECKRKSDRESKRRTRKQIEKPEIKIEKVNDEHPCDYYISNKFDTGR
jgi:hypothetical protein